MTDNRPDTHGSATVAEWEHVLDDPRYSNELVGNMVRANKAMFLSAIRQPIASPPPSAPSPPRSPPMADRDTLLSLAERCEKAEGRDRELDRAIWRAAVNRSGFVCPDERDGHPNVPSWIKLYTASIDAALSLVPEGHRTRIAINEDGEGAAWVYNRLSDPPTDFADYCATPALAVCAAVLRAHAALNADNGGPDGS